MNVCWWFRKSSIISNWRCYRYIPLLLGYTIKIRVASIMCVVLIWTLMMRKIVILLLCWGRIVRAFKIRGFSWFWRSRDRLISLGKLWRFVIFSLVLMAGIVWLFPLNLTIINKISRVIESKPSKQNII